MEGIYDAAARDDCFLCALLYPNEHADDCPRCHKAMRLQPPMRVDAPALEQSIRVLANAYERRPELESLETLLVEVHRFYPVALEILEEQCNLDLSQLRRAWNELTQPR